jgi:hypothetical protein
VQWISLIPETIQFLLEFDREHASHFEFHIVRIEFGGGGESCDY